MKHGTPRDVVKLLSKHIPISCRSVLEPAVGEGALLAPFLSGKYKSFDKLTAIDINKVRLKECKTLLSDVHVEKLLLNNSFLDWTGDGEYDCVIMNPPFNAKKSDSVVYEGDILPIEAAFLKKAVSHLSCKGVLIAIIPASIVSSDSLTAFRHELLTKHISIKKVYELNRFSFPGIEGKFYVLIARKVKRLSGVELEKPFIESAVSIKLSRQALKREKYRLDFSFHFSKIKLEEIIGYDRVVCKPLSEVSMIDRGKVVAPFIDKNTLHTSGYQKGMWSSSVVMEKSASGLTAGRGDLLVKRVSRNCHLTFGIYNHNESTISDCVFRIRPSGNLTSDQLLFAIRVIYSNPLGKKLLVKGTGASYISAKSLMEAPIPINLHELFPDEFRQYKRNGAKADPQLRSRIEDTVFNRLAAC
jgi:type I restriction enzyme M protein